MASAYSIAISSRAGIGNRILFVGIWNGLWNRIVFGAWTIHHLARGCEGRLRDWLPYGPNACPSRSGQNISGFNAEVDRYNAWVQQNFGDDANLLMSKIVTASGAPITSQSYLEASPISIGSEQRRPFNASSEPGKFGKKQVMTEIPPGSLSQKHEEAIAVDQVLRNF
jgi:hypothetical protein